MSVCHIETDRTFESGRPVPGGLLDLRLGTIDRLWKCTSCGMDQTECPGHFGHIELAKPMYHLSFINNVLKTLRCVCFSCSSILGNEPVDDLKGPDQVQRKLMSAFKKKNPAHRLRGVMEIAKTQKHCWSCSQDQPSLKRDGLTLQAEWKESSDVRHSLKTPNVRSPKAQPSRPCPTQCSSVIPLPPSAARVPQDHEARKPARRKPVLVSLATRPVDPPGGPRLGCFFLPTWAPGLAWPREFASSKRGSRP